MSFDGLRPFLVAIDVVKVYRRKLQDREHHGSSCSVFQAGTGALVVNDSGLVFAIERKAVPGYWQLPHGGLDEGEEPLQAVYRELFEEEGIAADALELLGNYPESLVYELPPEYRMPKIGRGQV
jgi:8-oxo-dGTP pyrophosphatase MutT (NUDIX family)